MAKGQQRSNKEKKKPKQDKKKLAPAPSPLASDQHGKPGWGGKKKLHATASPLSARFLMRYRPSAYVSRCSSDALPPSAT